MKFRKEDRLAEERKYASAGDFEEVFAKDRDHLGQLAFLLAGDTERSELITASSLQDSVRSTGVFKDWAQNWARHTIIQNAIRVVNPHPREHADFYAPANSPASEPLKSQDREFALNRILALDDFDRFVFVITVLERYSEHDCALLLSAFFRDVRHSRLRAMQMLATLDHAEAAFAGSTPPEYARLQLQDPVF